MQEHVYDVVVLGTGAAGLTAALRAAAGGAQVGLFEKADTVGGTSAWSGGTVWLPNNRHEAELGFTDSREEVLTYLMSLSHGLMEQPLVEAYVDTAPEVAAWLEDNSPVEFETLRGMSDYHPEHPGGKQEGRSLECTLFPFADLGDWAHRVTVGWQLTGEITMSESSLGRKAPAGVPREELDRRKLRDERGAGQALVGRLLRGCLDRGVHPQVRCRGVRLLVGADRVTGVLIEGPDGPFEARPRRCRAGDRRVRTRRAARPGILARAAGTCGQRAHEHRRWAPDGDARWHRPDRHARSLVGADHRGGCRRVGPRAMAGQHRTDSPAYDHGQR